MVQKIKNWKLIIIIFIIIIALLDAFYFSNYEKRFFAWLEDNSVQKGVFFYDRKEANGSVRLLHFTPHQQNNSLIILLHGGGNDCLFPNISLIKKLLKANFTVITFDLDGHGRYSTTSYDYKEISSSLECLFMNIEPLYPEKNRILIGYSLGGAIMLNSLSKSNQKITAAVAISVPIKLDINASSSKELLSLLKLTYFEQIFDYGFFGIIPAVGSFKRKTFPVRINDNYLTNNISYYNYTDYFSKTVMSFELKKNAELIKTPVLLLVGTQDNLATVADAEVLHKLISNSTISIIEGETHFTTFFSSKTECELLNWLTQFD